MMRLGHVLGCAAAAIALVGCGGGTGTSSDGGAGRGGAGAGGGAIGIGGNGTGGNGTAGIAGVAGTSGSAGTNGSGGASGTAGQSGVAGISGAAGISGTAGHATGIGGMNCRPDILIVQDRSGSMNDDYNDQSCTGGCGANSKWSQESTAITNVIGTTDTRVNWGIKYFPDNNACDAALAPAVAIAPSNGVAVAASIAATVPGGTTPTRDAINFGASYLLTLTDTNPKFLLLATDGLPNCPIGCAAMTNPSTTCTVTDNPTEDQAVEMAVMTAATQGIKTFVIGIGNVTTAQNTLNQLAIAGGEPQPGGATSYYAATDETALELALSTIVGRSAVCPSNP
jgi:von Willebrand factor type A domain